MNKTYAEQINELKSIFSLFGIDATKMDFGCPRRATSQDDSKCENAPESVHFVSDVKYDESIGASVLTIEVPGVEREDISVTTEKGALTVSVSKKLGKPVSYTSSWSAPRHTDIDTVTSTLKNGILTVNVFESKSSKKKTITIH